MHTQIVSARKFLNAALLLALAAPALARDPIGDPIDLPPFATGVRLVEHPLAQQILEGTSQSLDGLDIDVSLVAGESATSGDCLGVKISAGHFALDFGSVDFHMDSSGVELTITIDSITLTAIKVKTKSPVSFCDWAGAIEVGGTASDIKLTVRCDPRIRLDDCYLVHLGEVSAHVSIGGLNLKPLQNDIDKLMKGLIEDAINEKIDIDLPDILKDAFSNSLLYGICQSKLFIYKAYMAALSAGVNFYSFPDDLVEQLQPLFPTVNLGSIQFGYRWQPKSNNTTDCNKIFFSDSDMVERLRHGAELDENEWNLVFHELQHTEQCAGLGSRDEFAKMWFHDFELAVLMTHLSNPVSYLWELHDNMPMEVDATDRSGEIVVVHGTVRDTATLSPVSDIAVSAYPPGVKPILIGTTPIASDVSSLPGLKGMSAGRYTFFLEAGVYDLYLRPITVRIPQVALRGFNVESWDLAIQQDFLIDANGEPHTPPQPTAAPVFLRGDSNTSAEVNISDVLFTLGWLFADGDSPRCEKAADVNDDGKVDVSDPLALLGYMFLGASEPPAPFQAAGTDPTADSLSCEAGQS